MKMIKFFSLFLLTSVLYAKEVTLLEQPQADAKSVGKLDLSVGVIPIFMPKGSEWIKVADPRNGNVGWVKASEIGASNFTFTQRIINDGKGTQSYQVIQYGNQPQLSDEELQNTMQKMQQQQKAVQENTQKAFNQMMKDLNMLYQGWFDNFPMVMPIVIMPTAKKEEIKTPESPKQEVKKPTKNQ